LVPDGFQWPLLQGIHALTRKSWWYSCLTVHDLMTSTGQVPTWSWSRRRVRTRPDGWSYQLAPIPISWEPKSQHFTRTISAAFWLPEIVHVLKRTTSSGRLGRFLVWVRRGRMRPPPPELLRAGIRGHRHTDAETATSPVAVCGVPGRWFWRCPVAVSVGPDGSGGPSAATVAI